MVVAQIPVIHWAILSIDTKKGEDTKMANELKLSKKDRISVWWRSTFIQGSWNYERTQSGGWAFTLIPAIKKLYKTKEERVAAMKRHLEFFNTHPYLASPIIGVTLALEEERANGAPIDDVTIQGVKVGMMGPLAGIGDPVFWFTVRPILGALAASLAISGNILGPIIFFVAWNIIRMGFMWYTQEFGYKAGSHITDDLTGGILQDVTKGASILGMFILGSLVNRWVSVKFAPVVSSVQLSKGAFIDWSKLPAGTNGVKQALMQQAGGLSLTDHKITTLQNNLDSLIPGLAGLLITFICMWLLKKKVSPIVIILGLFAIGIVFHLIGLM
ncbi:PTS system D-glucose-specific IID component, Man family [Clostridium acidisoli DSM 12555]|uniref:PTS system D-glucose-specific IID component, Man family n=2 Tax=Clostridium TaxID=1485 RepID=A0A1W1X862_9CLOT|nr:PTS system D-glucose-specific IID component, Man family [Clostridium acidisoli DSM 12555]